MTSFNTIIDCNSSARTLANLLKMTDEVKAEGFRFAVAD